MRLYNTIHGYLSSIYSKTFYKLLIPYATCLSSKGQTRKVFTLSTRNAQLTHTSELETCVSSVHNILCQSWLMQLNSYQPMFYLQYVYFGFGGLGVACWPLVPKFAGSNPAKAVGFFGRKNPQHAFLRRGSKAVDSMS